MTQKPERCTECGHTAADHEEGRMGGWSSEHGPLCHTNTHSCYHESTTRYLPDDVVMEIARKQAERWRETLDALAGR